MRIAGTGAAMLLVAAATLIALYLGRGRKATATPFEQIKVTRLTHGGSAQEAQGWTGSRAALSPDGRFVAHFRNDAEGRASLWIQNIATSSAVQILPASEDRPIAPVYSPDGNYIYYLAHPNGSVSQLHRVPVLGGPPEPLPIQDIDTPVSFSPDGKQAAFARNDMQNLIELHVAHLDGSGRKVLAVTTPTITSPGGPAWSPDGRTLAWTRRGEDTRCFVQLVDVQTGMPRRLGDRAWDGAGELEWMPGSRGLLLIARDNSLGPQFQIWHVEVPSGKARPITSDVADYFGLSVSADGRSLVSVRTEDRSDIWLAPFDDPKRATQVTFASDNQNGDFGLAWTPAGGLVYTSRAGGTTDLWLMDRPGEKPRRLTSEATTEALPRVSPDGRTIVYVAGRPDGSGAIWRMDADGSDPKRLTPGPRDGMPLVTRDGRWVLYTCFSPGTRMWRVPTEGGTPELLGGADPQRQELFKDFWGVAQSPDGRMLAGWVADRRGFTLAVAPLDGNGPREEIQEPLPLPGFAYWAADGRSLHYEVMQRAAIFRKTLDKSPATPYLDLKEGIRCFFAVSPDGKQLAYAHEAVSSDVVLIQDARADEGTKR